MRGVARGLLVVFLLTLGISSWRVYAQTSPSGGGAGGFGGGTANSCALFDASATLTSDTGCTYTGTGSTFNLNVGGTGLTIGGTGAILLANSSYAATPAVDTEAVFLNASDQVTFKTSIGALQLDQSAQTAARTLQFANVDGTNCQKIAFNTTSFTPGSTASDLTAWTYTFPAAAMPTNGGHLHIKAWGTRVATANSTTPKIKFGATTLIGTAITSATATQWILEGDVLRTGAATQIGSGEMRLTGVVGAITTTTPGETLSGAVTVLVTLNAATTATDITSLGGFAEFCN